MSAATSLRLTLVAGAALLLAACGGGGRYTWGEYDYALYDFYQSPENRGTYRTALEEVMDDASDSRPVPPGLYAELGYIELEDGNTERAIHMFQLEMQTWPESAVLMTRMIRAARTTAGEPSSGPPQPGAPGS